MAKELSLVKITICGPSDVTKEIESAKKSIEEWNQLHGAANGLAVQHFHWSTDSFPDASETGQGAINRQIIDQADILVAIFWSRLGTPTKIAVSGTAEEIERGIAQKKKVLVYFSDLEPFPAGAAQAQIDLLWSFRQKLRAASSCWTFASRSKFQSDFANHIALALNSFSKPPAKTKPNKRVRAVKQQATGNGNIQSVGDGNEFHQHNYTKPPIIKKVIERPEGCISSEQNFQIGKWIGELAEGTVGEERSEAYAEWTQHFKNRFKIGKRELLLDEQMGEAEAWYREQRAIQKSGYKTKAPQQWRNSRYASIKRAMNAMGREKIPYYRELQSRLKIEKPFDSLTKLTKTDLDRLYRMVLSDERKGLK